MVQDLTAAGFLSGGFSIFFVDFQWRGMMSTELMDDELIVQWRSEAHAGLGGSEGCFDVCCRGWRREGREK